MNTLNKTIVKLIDRKLTKAEDMIAVEEPLEIFVNDLPFHMTMRLLGEEIPLAVGNCFSEGLIQSNDDLLSVNYCKEISSNRINVYIKNVSTGDSAQTFKQKHSVSFTSCGLCGKELITDIVTAVKNSAKTFTITRTQLAVCRDIVASSQETYRLTLGTHAAGIFSNDGEPLALSEDIGRHNALDKAIGKVLLNQRQKEACIIILTSRLSFEMVQKASRLGVEILAGESATTSLAIDLANSSDITLIGSFKGNQGKIYTHPERVI